MIRFNIFIVDGGCCSSGMFHVVVSPVIGSCVCCVSVTNLLRPRLPPNLFPNNGNCSSGVNCGLLLLFGVALPAARPTTPPTTPLIILAACEFPNAVLAPAATPKPILAPSID